MHKARTLCNSAKDKKTVFYFLEKNSTKSAIVARGTHTYLLWRATYWRGQVWQSDPNGHKTKKISHHWIRKRTRMGWLVYDKKSSANGCITHYKSGLYNPKLQPLTICQLDCLSKKPFLTIWRWKNKVFKFSVTYKGI